MSDSDSAQPTIPDPPPASNNQPAVPNPPPPGPLATPTEGQEISKGYGLGSDIQKAGK